MMLSYNCKKVTKIREIGPEGPYRIVLANLQFVNEHNIELKPAKHVLVAIRDNTAKIVRNPEDILPEDTTEEKWRMWENLCGSYPGPEYDVYNEEEFSTFF